MKIKIFVVTMCRFGDTESHHYVIGAFSKKAAAIKAGEMEREYRGGKYEYVIDEHILDEFPEAAFKMYKNQSRY
jgi:hypothetical protein